MTAHQAAQVATDSKALWLALALTEGLGPTRARRLVERFGTIESLFRASLTELEAAGIPAVSAQALGTGKSLELAQEESVKIRAAGVEVVTLDDPTYPLACGRFTTLHFFCTFADRSIFCLKRELR